MNEVVDSNKSLEGDALTKLVEGFKPSDVSKAAEKFEATKPTNDPLKREKWANGREKAGIYERDQKGVYCNGKKIEWADLQTFQVLKGRYAKDLNYVYCNENKLEWANPKTIQNFDPEGEYIKDDKNVYFRWDIIKWVDVQTFQILQRPVSKDKNHVYRKNEIFNSRFAGTGLETPDPQTFEILNKYTARDKKYVWDLALPRIIEWEDPKTIQVIQVQ